MEHESTWSRSNAWLQASELILTLLTTKLKLSKVSLPNLYERWIIRGQIYRETCPFETRNLCATLTGFVFFILTIYEKMHTETTILATLYVYHVNYFSPISYKQDSFFLFLFCGANYLTFVFCTKNKEWFCWSIKWSRAKVRPDHLWPTVRAGLTRIDSETSFRDL